MNFDILEEITEIETISKGSGIREIKRRIGYVVGLYPVILLILSKKEYE